MEKRMPFKRALMLGISMLISACAANLQKTSDSSISSLNQPPRENASRSAAELAKTIKEIMGISLVQDKFETNTEYINRVKSLFLQYDGRRYEVTESCHEEYGRWERRRLVDYDVASSSLVLTLPDMDAETMQVDNRRTYRELYSSFIAVGEPEQSVGKYIASNSFGNRREVVKLREQKTGVAILTEGLKFYKTVSDSWSFDSYMNSKPKPKQFKMSMHRDIARNVIDSCKVVFDVESVFGDIYPYQMRTIRDTGNQPMRSILFRRLSEYTEPKMDNPYDIERWRYEMPVRLLAVKIMSRDGESLLFNKNFY